MHNNNRGSYRMTAALAMAAYDRLPPEARHALANAVDNWVAQPLLTWYRRGKLEAADIVAQIDRWNRRELAKWEDQRARAIGPYRGNAPSLERPSRRKARR